VKPRAVLSRLEPYVPGKRIRGGIKLSSNENPLGPSPRSREAVEAMLHDVHRYPDGSMHALKQALGDHWSVDPESIIVGNGSDEIFVMIAGSVVEPGTNAVTAAHTFSQYTFATQIFGGEIRTTPMRDGRFDLEAVGERIDDQTRIVFLCSPNNPTGTIITAGELERFLDHVPSHVLVVIDEAYGEYAQSDDYPDTLALVPEHPNLIRMRTFSKIYGLAALRVGYGIAQPRVIEAISKLRQPFNVGTLSQAAAAAALEDTDFVARSLENNRTEKRRLYEFLDSHGIGFFPTEANFVCADFGDSAQRIVEALRRERIAVRPLGSFGMPAHLRITIGTPDEMDALYEALERIGLAAPAGR
jgi:histidinol-phosphate aminotransferase